MLAVTGHAAPSAAYSRSFSRILRPDVDLRSRYKQTASASAASWVRILTVAAPYPRSFSRTLGPGPAQASHH